MKHRFLNIFLILVLLIQVLPVKQMGELLFNNQLNEEITCSDSGCKEINKSIESSVELEEGLQFALILASSSTPLFENGVASRGGKAVRADAGKPKNRLRRLHVGFLSSGL